MNPVIAVVIWEDAQMGGHWQEGPAPDDDGPCHVYSVGWLLQETSERLVMVQSMADGQHGNSLIIPKGMVRKMSKMELK